MKQLIIAATMMAALNSGVCRAQSGDASLNELWKRSTVMEKTKGGHRHAIKSYSEILKHPKASKDLKREAQLRIAICKLRLGEHDDAVKDLKVVFRNHPKLAKRGVADVQEVMVGEKKDGAENPNKLLTVLYTVDPLLFTKDKEAEVDFTDLFQGLGVKFPTMATTIMFDRGTSTLVVRNTADQLQRIEQILTFLAVNR